MENKGDYFRFQGLDGFIGDIVSPRDQTREGITRSCPCPDPNCKADEQDFRPQTAPTIGQCPADAVHAGKTMTVILLLLLKP